MLVGGHHARVDLTRGNLAIVLVANGRQRRGIWGRDGWLWRGGRSEMEVDGGRRSSLI